MKKTKNDEKCGLTPEEEFSLNKDFILDSISEETYEKLEASGALKDFKMVDAIAQALFEATE